VADVGAIVVVGLTERKVDEVVEQEVDAEEEDN